MKEQPGAALVAGNGTRDGPRLGLHVDTRVTANLQDQLEMVTEPGQEEKTQWRVPSKTPHLPEEIVHLVGQKTRQHPLRTGFTPALKQPAVFLSKLGCYVIGSNLTPASRRKNIGNRQQKSHKNPPNQMNQNDFQALTQQQRTSSEGPDEKITVCV